MWTVMRGSFQTTGGLGYHKHLLVPLTPRGWLLRSHLLFLALGMLHVLAPAVYRTINAKSDQLELRTIDHVVAVGFALGGLPFTCTLSLKLSQLCMEVRCPPPFHLTHAQPVQHKPLLTCLCAVSIDD